MGTWILVLVMYQGGLTSLTTNYNNERSCYNATKEIRKQIENSQEEGRLHGRIIALACTRKG